MRTRTTVLSLTALVSGAVVFGMILAGSLDLTRRASAQKDPVPATAPAAPSRPQPLMAIPSFADIAEQVMPAIVTVTATDIVKPQARQGVPFHHFGDGESPFDFFLPGPGQGRGDDEEHKELSGGTGFIIDPDGYILTNDHVIHGAEKVEIKVGDQDDYRATVVGRDPASDLALLKISGTKPFPVVKLGDSDRLRVGDWVMAIGDPLNFDKTVTVGVVSGKGRQAGLSQATASFENLIQTDAAINFGNSGGPLVNVAGEVIGINTAISRFAQNIGFAVPINMAKRLLPQLKKGKVVRGYLGVRIESITKRWQEAFDLKTAQGALIDSVEAGKPGDKAGLTHGDVVVKVDDQTVKNNRDLIDYVSGLPPGSKVKLTFIREGKEKTTVATLETRPEEGEEANPEEETRSGRQRTLGLELADLSPMLRRQYMIDRDTAKGVVVTHVKPISPAADANIAEGDVILELNGVAVGSVDDLQAQLKKAPKGKYLRFYIQRATARGSQRFLTAVKPEGD